VRYACKEFQAILSDGFEFFFNYLLKGRFKIEFLSTY